MDETTKDELIARFRFFLDSGPELEDDIEKKDSIDLFRLFSELTALKSEVKIESRQVKTAIDEFKNILQILETTNRQLNDRLAEEKVRQSRAADEALRPLLLDLLDIYDRFFAGLAAFKRSGPSSFFFKFCRREQASFAAVCQGQDMTMQRIDDMLTSYGVRPVDALYAPFDPGSMRAVGVAWRSDQTEGVVIEEVRKGFMLGETVLRPAEVKVNRREK